MSLSVSEYCTVLFAKLHAQFSPSVFGSLAALCFYTSPVGHRPGQDVGLMQWPSNRTRLAGQWQPATQGLRQGPISFQLLQVLVQPGPHVS